MKLSIVTTLYKSSEYIQEFYERITSQSKLITNDYEIIFVDDGSPDDSLQKAIGLYQNDSRVKVIELSRNFGHHKAIMTGLSDAKGDYVFLIDSDLEEEPELLGKFWNELHSAKDIDVVYGVQETRKGGWFEKVSGNLFYSTLNKISNINLTKNIITCRLTTKQYNKALVSHKEREIFLAGLWEITGFNQLGIIIKKQSSSPTTYSLKHKLAVLLNSVTSFSNFPLKLIFNMGLSISIFSFTYIIYIAGRKLFFNISLEGWTSLIVSVWFLSGLIIFSIGTLGLYIAKIFTETKQRPYTIIRKKYEKN
ncbi:glycosyltransferase family 2 protein [Francisella philomiragia]|uniref:glycosyltransferase family 2 protein n=1 Tax=Francisella philomiragia TaxID=28110 RepID=UPI000B591304|nr:glycosyltransferase family 2 protein [Francisella philomiragia]MBK2094139.1 glycosyltransferase family 2 protein [Francisella philomiragia]